MEIVEVEVGQSSILEEIVEVKVGSLTRFGGNRGGPNFFIARDSEILDLDFSNPGFEMGSLR